MDQILSSSVGMFVVLFLMLLAVVGAILWIFLPFAVFGIKAKLDAQTGEIKQTNALLRSLAEQAARKP